MFGNNLSISLHSPFVHPGNVKNNVKEHLKLINDSSADLNVFPELSLSGYHCGDIFFNKKYIHECYEGIKNINEACLLNKTIAVFGCPLEINRSLYNCAIICGLQNDIVARAKVELAVSQEYYEQRWFKSGLYLDDNSLFIYENLKIQVKNTLSKIDINFGSYPIRFAIDICEDAWAEISPSMLIDSPDLILNLSASSDTISSRQARRFMMKGISERKKCPYLYVSGSTGESTSISLLNNIHLVYYGNNDFERYFSSNKELKTSIKIDIDSIRSQGNHKGIRSNLILKNFDLKTKLTYPYKDEIFKAILKKSNSFSANIELPEYSAKPFHEEISFSNNKLKDIFDIQVSALKRRLVHTNSKSAIVGLSGGIDSAYALMVVVESCKSINCEPIPIVLPSIGSSIESQSIAKELARKLTNNEIEYDLTSITNSSIDLYSLEDPLAKENIQSRLRTTALMTIANEKKGIMVGTGNMSELAIGWCTYNADNMSMYNPNGGLPKTVLVDLAYEISNFLDVQPIIKEILKRPFTPELETLDNHENQRTTEDRIGLYEVIDFCLYYTLTLSMTREEAKNQAKFIFKDLNKEKIEFSVNSFYDRFIPSQFKRTIVPDSPKLFSFDLSPRGCLRIPSDIKNPY